MLFGLVDRTYDTLPQQPHEMGREVSVCWALLRYEIRFVIYFQGDLPTYKVSQAVSLETVSAVNMGREKLEDIILDDLILKMRIHIDALK